MVYNNNYMNHVVNINTRTTTSVVIRLYIYHSTIYLEMVDKDRLVTVMIQSADNLTWKDIVEHLFQSYII